jgi:Fe-S-cluster formation regulator IscX/YfhJ
VTDAEAHDGDDEVEVDLDLSDLEAEAEGRPFVFGYGSGKYRLPSKFDMRAAALLGSDDPRAPAQVLHIMLGDQLDDFLDEPTVFSERMLERVLKGWSDHSGVDLGKLPGSSRSSRRAVKPSKRTSGGSTASRSGRSQRAS